MNIESKIIEILSDQATPLCDDCLAKRLGGIMPDNISETMKRLKNELNISNKVMFRSQKTCAECGRFKTVSWIQEITSDIGERASGISLYGSESSKHSPKCLTCGYPVSKGEKYCSNCLDKHFL